MENVGVIKKPILTKLSKRFNISQTSNPLFMSDTVIPITNLDSISIKPTPYTTTGTATSRTDTYTVPEGKRWTFVIACIDRAQTGIATFDVTISGTTYRIDSAATALVTTFKGYNNLILDSGDSFVINAGTGTSGVIISNILVIEEDYTPN